MLCAFATALVVSCGGDSVTPPDGTSLASSGMILFAYSPDISRRSLADLYVVRADGTGKRLVSALPGAELWPDWSPDGKRLVFTRVDENQSYTVWVENADGTGLRRLASDAEGAYARWSGDGQWIVFERRGADWRGLALIRPDGTGMRRITLPSPHVPGISAVISVKGRLAFEMGDGPQIGTLWTSNLDGSDLTQISATVSDLDPRWSPDGTKLAVASTSLTGTDIVVMNADGSGRQVLTPPGVNYSPAWSPDGKWIVYDHLTAEPPSAKHGSLYRVPSSGGTPELVLSGAPNGGIGGLSWVSASLP